MRNLFVLLACCAGLLAAAPARADAVVDILPGERLSGSLPKDEIFRVRFPLAKGAIPKLKIKFTGQSVAVSIPEVRFYGPDGKEIAQDTTPEDGITGPVYKQRIRAKTSAHQVREFAVPESGTYEMTMRTNARGPLFVDGRLTVKRVRKVKFEADETSEPFTFELQQGDRWEMNLKSISGGLPRVISLELPSGGLSAVGQRETKKGVKTFLTQAPQTGTYKVRFGYSGGVTTGTFKGKYKLTPVKGLRLAQVFLRNPAGVELSVRQSDRSLEISNANRGVGLAYDGANMLITTETPGGDVVGRLFDKDLTVLPGTSEVNLVGVTNADVPPGDPVTGHRLLHRPGTFYIAYTTQSQQRLGIASLFDTNNLPANWLGRTSATELIATSPTPIIDPFLTTDGTDLSLGYFVPPTTHDVFVLGADLKVKLLTTIGSVERPQTRAAGAAFRGTTKLFDFFAPDNTDPAGPSDLHRQSYTPTWQAMFNDELSIGTTSDVETSPTAVSIDPLSQVAIVHYVVADGSGLGGEIHRRLFDLTGLEVPGSHWVLVDALGTPKTRLNAPTSQIVDISGVGPVVYLGYETQTGYTILRFPLLR